MRGGGGGGRRGVAAKRQVSFATLHDESLTTVRCARLCRIEPYRPARHDPPRFPTRVPEQWINFGDDDWCSESHWMRAHEQQYVAVVSDVERNPPEYYCVGPLALPFFTAYYRFAVRFENRRAREGDGKAHLDHGFTKPEDACNSLRTQRPRAVHGSVVVDPACYPPPPKEGGVPSVQLREAFLRLCPSAEHKKKALELIESQPRWSSLDELGAQLCTSDEGRARRIVEMLRWALSELFLGRAYFELVARGYAPASLVRLASPHVLAQVLATHSLDTMLWRFLSGSGGVVARINDAESVAAVLPESMRAELERQTTRRTLLESTSSTELVSSGVGADDRAAPTIVGARLCQIRDTYRALERRYVDGGDPRPHLDGPWNHEDVVWLTAHRYWASRGDSYIPLRIIERTRDSLRRSLVHLHELCVTQLCAHIEARFAVDFPADADADADKTLPEPREYEVLRDWIERFRTKSGCGRAYAAALSAVRDRILCMSPSRRAEMLHTLMSREAFCARFRAVTQSPATPKEVPGPDHFIYARQAMCGNFDETRMSPSAPKYAAECYARWCGFGRQLLHRPISFVRDPLRFATDVLSGSVDFAFGPHNVHTVRATLARHHSKTHLLVLLHDVERITEHDLAEAFKAMTYAWNGGRARDFVAVVCTYSGSHLDLGGLSLLSRTLDELRATASFDISIDQHVDYPSRLLPPVPGLDELPTTMPVEPTLRLNPSPDECKCPQVDAASCVALYHRTPAPALRYIVDIPPLPLPATFNVPESELRLMQTLMYYAGEFFIDLVTPSGRTLPNVEMMCRDLARIGAIITQTALEPLESPVSIWEFIDDEEKKEAKRVKRTA